MELFVNGAKLIGSGLATIGLTKQILYPILSPRLLCPSIVSPLAIKAIHVVDDMLKSLPVNSPVLQHILSIASQCENLLEVTASTQEGLVIPFSNIEFSNKNIPSGKVRRIAGTYVFTEKGLAPGQTIIRQAFGSTTDFPRRLNEHKNQFSGRSQPTSLHKLGNDLGGISAFHWGTIYVLPNYLLSFYMAHPNYSLSKGEYNILIAVTQLVPRILEQSLFQHFTSALSGKDQLVRFTYSKYNPLLLNEPLLLDRTSKRVKIIKNNKITQIASSQQETANILGVSYNVILRYLNHEKVLKSPVLGLVNIQEIEYGEKLLAHNIIHRKETNYPSLIIPNLDYNNLVPNLLYAFNLEFVLIGVYKSMTEASKLLCISGNSSRGLRNSISRAINKDHLVNTCVGSLYFAQHISTNRIELFYEGKYPCILHDLLLNSEMEFKGLKTVETYLSNFEYKKENKIKKVTYDRLLTSYKTGKIIFDRFKIVPLSI